MKDFDKESMDFFLPKSFKGLSKQYIMDAIYDEEIQAAWKPQIGDVIVGGTGNVFVISAYHKTHEDLGGDKYFFGGGLCNRTGGCFLDSTFAFVMNEDGMRYYYSDNGVEKEDDPYYSKFSNFRYVPYPHEKNM